jgi:hypothetical protein
MAQEPGGSFSRGVLARELLPGGYVAPRFDKPVLFKDISYYGILPQSLGMSGAVMIGSGLIRSSLQNLSRLPSLNAKPDEFVLINGYPRTADQIKAVFGSESQFDLDDWQEVAGEIEGIAIKHGISIESAEAGESFNEKAELLKLLTEAPHAIFLVAHADGCHIRLPGGGEIVLRPEDVYELRFEHAPFVVVRICNGVDNGYASAFLNAGASGVWMNRGVITPSQANSEIDLFLGALEEEKTVVDAVKAANAAATSSGLFVEQLPATRQRSVGMAR